jgi:hypothetical protein
MRNRGIKIPPQKGGKKLIVLESYGDHSNRLLQSIHYEAFCIENNIGYINLSFRNMTKYYEGCRLNSWGYYFIHKVLSLNIFGRICRKAQLTKNAFTIADVLNRIHIIKVIECDAYSADYTDILLNALRKYNTVYVRGWFFWHILTEKYGVLFRKKYTLKEIYYKNNLMYNKVIELKNRNTLIGVHIRKGDYKEWHNGKYYYEDDVYYRIMEKLKRLIGDNCVYIIFSNGNVEFVENEELYISKEAWYIDQYLMTQCDYLIGAPSTFSRWASYMNNIKCYHIRDVNKEITLEDFVIYKG